MTQKSPSLFDCNIVGPAIGDSFRKLDPRLMIRNSVMFVTMVGAALTTAEIFTSSSERGFIAQLAVWLWFTVLFANFAEAVAEGRGKAQAASLRKARTETMARRLRNGREERVPAPDLEKCDTVVGETGDVIPADGDVIDGIASVDEAAITGESAPVIRESGGDRSAVTGGTRVLSDRIVIRITMDKGHGFLDRIIALVEGAQRQKTPNEIALTAAAIAAEAGVDDFMAQATPEQKLKRIRDEQAAGHLVAMTGDGTNDAPALAQADVGVAMNTGTQAAREAGDMVDLDSNPTKLIDIVEIGKQMLMTRGSLTTFSIANDVTKYFAIIPAMLMVTFPAVVALNVMRLASPQSAMLSAVIFNALIIIALIPLALRGVKYTPIGALATLRRNLLIYGQGGVIIPFIGIKLIDILITALKFV